MYIYISGHFNWLSEQMIKYLYQPHDTWLLATKNLTAD